MRTEPPAGPPDDGGPESPPVPSFASLRQPARPSPLDALFAAPPPSVRSADPAPGPAARTSGSRPPDTDDLRRLGALLAGRLVGLPCRVARWSVQTPVRTARRLLDG